MFAARSRREDGEQEADRTVVPAVSRAQRVAMERPCSTLDRRIAPEVDPARHRPLNA